MAEYELERLLVQVRRIEEHREKGAEAEIRKTYQKLLQELRHYMADEYSRYAEDDKLTYDILQRNGYYARFLEEVEQKINDISPEVRRTIRSSVEQAYEHTYNGMINCVGKVATGVDLGSLKACTPEVIKRAVENPISKLTLNDRLEKHRREIIYDIKQDISVGLINGDRYSTMANRIKKSVEGDYKKAVRIARTETHRVREAGNHDAAISVNDALKNSTVNVQMMKTWRTMKDERVRPAKAKGKNRKYDHRKMEGVSIPIDEEFTLPSGTKTMAPGQSGVAGEDINCRCYLSYSILRKQKIENSETIEWPTKQSSISKEQYIELRDYAKLQGIEITGFKHFDGDIELIKQTIASMSEIANRYPKIREGRKKLTLELAEHMNSKDFAITHGHIISINANAFRDRLCLEREYKKLEKSGWFVKNTTYQSIIKHEMGHVVANRYGINGLEIAKSIVDMNSKKTMNFIGGALSEYAGEWKDGSEIISEVFSDFFSNTTPKEFSLRFMSSCDRLILERGDML